MTVSNIGWYGQEPIQQHRHVQPSLWPCPGCGKHTLVNPSEWGIIYPTLRDGYLCTYERRIIYYTHIEMMEDAWQQRG